MTDSETTNKPDLHHTTHLAGVKFRDGAKERLDTLPAGTELTLEPEPANPYDANAVKVLHDGFHVGFIPKPFNVEILALISAGRVTRVTKRDDTGIRVSIWFRAEAPVDGVS